jgi:hypothetical protein
MYDLWWIAGETWCVDGHFSGAENSSLCQIYFCEIPILGMQLLHAVALEEKDK